MQTLESLASHYENFKKLNENTYNLRCPICGDSKTNKRKARGYIYSNNVGWHYFCHNCGIYKPLAQFIKETYGKPFLFLDTLSKSSSIASENNQSILDHLTPLTSLPEAHSAWKYVKSRHIPEERYHEIYYTHNPHIFKEKENYLPSIVFVCSYHHINVGVSCRNITGYGKRYFNHVTEYAKYHRYPYIYNYDNINFNKTIYITEGIIDSLFLPNSIGLNGLSNLNFVPCIKDYNHVIILDNEPNNDEVTKKLKQIIDRGYSVFLWDKNETVKDINDWVIKYPNENLVKMIRENTYTGLKAKLEFNKWYKQQKN